MAHERSRLVAIQRLMAEKVKAQRELAATEITRAHLRKRLRELDAALALQATPGAAAYFSAAEGGGDSPAVAGRIGVP